MRISRYSRILRSRIFSRPFSYRRKPKLLLPRIYSPYSKRRWEKGWEIKRDSTRYIRQLSGALFSRHPRYVWSERTLKRTKIKWIIRQAVESTGRDSLYDKVLIAQNKNLTEEQCRSLYNFLNIDTNPKRWGAYAVSNPNFPTDLLQKIVLSESSVLLLEIIADHPNANTETKVIATLRTR